jgi:hypothetical protein
MGIAHYINLAGNGSARIDWVLDRSAIGDKSAFFNPGRDFGFCGRNMATHKTDETKKRPLEHRTMWQTLRKQGIFTRSLALMIYEILLLAVITPFLWNLGSTCSFAAAGAAAGLCLSGSLLSLWIGYVFRDPRYVLTGVLLGMAINMFIPLAFGVMIHVYGGPLSQGGFLYYLVFFYLLTLAMKTMLTLPPARQSDG